MNKLIIVLFYAGFIIFPSCKKNISCENCNTINPPVPGNIRPIANAGLDQVITLPVDNVIVDGTGSSDPDGSIVSYSWTKISGPASSRILNPGFSKTMISELVQGIYQFKLSVKDDGGLNADDTIQVTVNPSLIQACNISFSPFGNLSIPRANPLCATAGNKILFAGGYLNTSPGIAQNSSRVDIYDFVSNTWSIAELSKPRHIMAVASAGNKIFFAGGYNNGTGTTRVDIYDASTNIWSISELSVARGHIGAATVGNKVVFAGGMDDNYDNLDVVDIYDIPTNTWSVQHLTEASLDLAGITVNNKIYFAGSYSDKVFIYDGPSATWSSILSGEPKGNMATIADGNKIYWAGGEGVGLNNNYTNKVQVFDVITGNSTFYQLSQSRTYLNAVRKK